MKKKAFYQGFEKKAAEAAPPEAAAPAAQAVAPERLLKWNPQGGVDPRSPEEMAQAQAVDLVTFPEGVEGANCTNCQFFRATDEGLGTGFCSQPEVKQDVTRSMCCARWNAPGTYRAWEAADPSAVPNPSIMSEAGALQNGEMGLPDPAAGGAPGGTTEGEPGTEDGDAGAVAESPDVATKKPAKKKEEKKKPEGKGHTINVNVGGEKTASIAELLDL